VLYVDNNLHLFLFYNN